jgi:hypothetical protein
MYYTCQMELIKNLLRCESSCKSFYILFNKEKHGINYHFFYNKISMSVFPGSSVYMYSINSLGIKEKKKLSQIEMVTLLHICWNVRS